MSDNSSPQHAYLNPGEHPVDVGLTHVALPVEHWNETIEFYAEFARMEVVHERGEPGERVAWISDHTRPFVIVLLSAIIGTLLFLPAVMSTMERYWPARWKQKSETQAA